jgi:hypothetical protein
LAPFDTPIWPPQESLRKDQQYHRVSILAFAGYFFAPALADLWKNSLFQQEGFPVPKIFPLKKSVY